MRNNYIAWSLFLANAILALLYGIGQLSRTEVLWIYFIQSILIGVFHFIKILLVKEYAGGQFFELDKPTRGPKSDASAIFLVLFGAYSGVFGLMLIMFTFSKDLKPPGLVMAGDIRWWIVAVISVLFCVNSVVSLILHPKKVHLIIFTFYPFLRMLPMAFIILAGIVWAAPGFVFFVFILLKIFADMLMEHLEHRSYL